MFREGMLICGLTDPTDLCSGEVAEVLAVHSSDILCRTNDGEIFAYFKEEFESHKIFPVGHVEPDWLGRKRWVYGLGESGSEMGWARRGSPEDPRRHPP